MGPGIFIESTAPHRTFGNANESHNQMRTNVLEFMLPDVIKLLENMFIVIPCKVVTYRSPAISFFK